MDSIIVQEKINDVDLYEKWKVPELQKQCRLRNFTYSGLKKIDLIQKLRQDDTSRSKYDLDYGYLISPIIPLDITVQYFFYLNFGDIHKLFKSKSYVAYILSREEVWKRLYVLNFNAVPPPNVIEIYKDAITEYVYYMNVKNYTAVLSQIIKRGFFSPTLEFLTKVENSGVKSDIKEKAITSALINAIGHKFPNIVYMMLEKYPQYLNNDDIFGAACGDMPELAKIMLKNMNHSNHFDLGGGICWAAGGGNLDIMDLLFQLREQYGYDFNYSNALHLASECGQLESIKYIIGKLKDGRDIIRDRDFMRSACFSDRCEVVEFWLQYYKQHGITYNIDKLCDCMCEPAVKGNVEILRLLIQYGGNFFNEALRLAAIYGRVEAVQLLINSGANNFSEVIMETKKKFHTENPNKEEIIKMLKEAKNKKHHF